MCRSSGPWGQQRSLFFVGSARSVSPLEVKFVPCILVFIVVPMIQAGLCPDSGGSQLRKFGNRWLRRLVAYVGQFSTHSAFVFRTMAPILRNSNTVRCVDAMFGRSFAKRATKTRRNLVFAAIIVFTLLDASLAICQHFCSGHGYCQLDQSCTCFSGWTGGDCSRRK
jgi:hypothetical protein